MTALRRENLKRLAQTRSVTEIGKQMGLQSSSYVSQLLNGQREISEKTARRIEQALTLDPQWMDREHEHLRPEDSLTMKAVQVVARVLQQTGVQVGPRRYAKMVEIAVAQAADGEIDEAIVRHMASLIQEE